MSGVKCGCVALLPVKAMYNSHIEMGTDLMPYEKEVSYHSCVKMLERRRIAFDRIQYV